MRYRFYFYITSKYSCLFHGEVYQRYCHYKMFRFSQDPVAIEPLDISSNDVKFEGIFRILYKQQGTNFDTLYYDAIEWLKRFLNMLTLYCQHGFKELDQHFYCGKDNDINNNLRLFEDSLPSLRESTFKPPKHKDTLHYIQQALQNTQQLFVVEKDCPNKCKKIENALFFLRLSYFGPDERVRYIMRFTALECLTDRAETMIDKALIDNIGEIARKVCVERQLQKNDIDKICGHIGQLAQESIKDSIKRLLDENKINMPNRYTIDGLCIARNKIVHEGKEILNSNNSPITHNYCDAIEKILTQLLQKLLAEFISNCSSR